MGPVIEQEVAKRVATEFEGRGLDKNLLDEMPFSICSIEEFERIMQIVAPRNILEFMDAKLSDPAKRLYRHTNHLWLITIEGIFRNLKIFSRRLSMKLIQT